ncbi:unnamed protein product [Durusdinium trenchii]|uniref:Uncharacterized protein n=1 Tax=Durusdinium trenchii TaxID=1381693 RepID=A0ABP0QF65_9DINO
MDSGYAAGYARRAQLGESKSNDRKRLLTDRNAYIAARSWSVENFNAAYLEVETLQEELRLVKGRMDLLEERFETSQRSVEMVKATLRHEAGQADRQDALEHMHRLESRALRLEQLVSDSRSTVEADMARLRNELSLSVQELTDRFDERLRASRERYEERLQALQDFSNDEAALVIREAQQTCVRLADDALAAAMSSQKKVEEVSLKASSAERRLEDTKQETEAGMEALRLQIVGLQADFAGFRATGEARWEGGCASRCFGTSAGQSLGASSSSVERSAAARRAVPGRLEPTAHRTSGDRPKQCPGGGR